MVDGDDDEALSGDGATRDVPLCQSAAQATEVVELSRSADGPVVLSRELLLEAVRWARPVIRPPPPSDVSRVTTHARSSRAGDRWAMGSPAPPV